MSLPSPHVRSGNVMGLDPKELEALDAPLIALANKSGGDLRKLLFAFFGFLHRRTDFYLVTHEDDVKGGAPIKMGFREGDAEKLLLAAFRQFPLRRIPRQAAAAAAASSVDSSSSPKNSNEKSKTETNEPTKASQDTPGAEPKKTPSKKQTDSEDAVRLTSEGLQIPVGNGGTTKRYRWTQTINECSVLVAVPEATKGKDLEVSIKSQSISVRMKKPLSGEDEPRTLVEGPLTEKIQPSESTWSLEGGGLILTLEKVKKTFWETVIEGDDKIDTSLVDSRRHIDEYDEATQAQLRKMIFDQSQERRGLPKSDEILGKKPQIPTLPPGVEYIDKETLDQHTSSERS